jgi:predicted RNA-binding protein Jag
MAKSFEGPTEAEAAIKACETLGVSRSQLKYTVTNRDEGPPRRIVISVEASAHPARSEDEPQPAHLAGEYDRLHGRGPRRESARPQQDRGRDSRGRRGGRRGPGARHEQEEYGDTLAEEYKEFREMTAAPKEPVTAKPALDEATLSERAQKALETTRQIMSLAALDATVQVSVDSDEQVLVDIHGADEGLIIGRKGETLLALQFLVNRLIGKESEGPERVAVDCEGYRERRQEALRVLALKLGDKARQEQKVVTVSPMNAHDRRIFHITLDGQQGLKTQSEGDGLFRRVMIIPDKAEAALAAPDPEQSSPSRR